MYISYGLYKSKYSKRRDGFSLLLIVLIRNNWKFFRPWTRKQLTREIISVFSELPFLSKCIICHQMYGIQGVSEGTCHTSGEHFVRLNYIYVTKNVCIRSWAVKQIFTRGICGILAAPMTVPVWCEALTVHCSVRPWTDSGTKPCGGACEKSTWRTNDEFYELASVVI